VEVEAAGETADGLASQGKVHAALNFDWETSCIEYLERSGQTEAAQAARWASVEAENLAFPFSRKHHVSRRTQVGACQRVRQASRKFKMFNNFSIITN
jgi:hypothetical protein